MNVITKIITLADPKQPMEIVPMSDMHISNIGCDEKYLKSTVDYIKNHENTYTMILGDVGDAIINGDKRFDVSTIAPRFRSSLDNLALEQYEYAKELLEPIADRIIVGYTGNHDETLRLKHSTDFIGWLYKELKVPYGGYSGFTILKFDRQQVHTNNVTIFAHHGYMAGRKVGAKMNMMNDLTSFIDADIYLTAHSHDLFINSKQKIYVDAGGKIKTKKVYLGQTGSFLNSFVEGATTYSEKALYPPSKIGCLKFKLYPTSKGVDIHCTE
jgi:predicted phosphodiesterase